MTRIIYVNGKYKSYFDALIHSEDRGFQFSDAVYEVYEVKNGQLVNARLHMARLSRSLGELKIKPPMPENALYCVISETVRRNRVQNGSVYLQVSRGVGPRNFLFSAVKTQPTLVCYARNLDLVQQKKVFERGIKVITHKETRWARCDIKTVMLL
ncbi:MAG: aminotransferase class IV, partial [Hyphomicrobiaceae bacterium]|nr:aminotransferase class IV [Hyphomicrobiaceae bacterium]